MTQFIAELYGHSKNNQFDSLCKLINNTVIFIQSYTHQTYKKKIQNKKHVNIKPKVLSNTMFPISGLQNMDIHHRTERLGQ